MVLVGFDFTKVKIRWQESTRMMIIKEFPEPEILSTDSDYKFYDIDQGFFNMFKNEEYTALLADVKQTMQTKSYCQWITQNCKETSIGNVEINGKFDGMEYWFSTTNEGGAEIVEWENWIWEIIEFSLGEKK